MALECAFPIERCNLRAEVDGVVTCSDACETGGGTCYSTRLSHLGAKEAVAVLLGKELPGEVTAEDDVRASEKILVVDFFAGVGGLPRALERAGARPAHVVVIEKEAGLRRLHRRRWPSGEERAEIEKVTKESLASLIRRVPGITGIVAGGGSPCQGLSTLNPGRQHLADPRSALFFKLASLLKALEKLAQEMKLWFWGFVENVVGDEKDVRLMSQELGWEPHLVDSCHFSRAKRPRLLWVDLFTELRFHGPTEPLALFLQQGAAWPAGEEDRGLRFPTFTRAIPRTRPPSHPAGLSKADGEARARWEADRFRFPPYTYQAAFMIQEKDVLRPLRAAEREIFMGFTPGHVKLMHRKEPSEADAAAEDAECAALGNSFHTGALAALIDLSLWGLGKKVSLKGIRRIQEAFFEVLSERPGPREAEVCSETEDERSPSVDYEGDETASVGSDRTAQVSSQLEALMEGPVRGRTLPAQAWEEQDKKLSVALAAQYVRRQEFRGSDVRLDLGLLFRPDAFPRASKPPAEVVLACCACLPLP